MLGDRRVLFEAGGDEEIVPAQVVVVKSWFSVILLLIVFFVLVVGDILVSMMAVGLVVVVVLVMVLLPVVGMIVLGLFRHWQEFRPPDKEGVVVDTEEGEEEEDVVKLVLSSNVGQLRFSLESFTLTGNWRLWGELACCGWCGCWWERGCRSAGDTMGSRSTSLRPSRPGHPLGRKNHSQVRTSHSSSLVMWWGDSGGDGGGGEGGEEETPGGMGCYPGHR